MNVPALITYPARPIQGGRLELAPPKRGLWYAEPKMNGWRALIHTQSGTMWNRHGTLLTVADCFRPALAALPLGTGRDVSPSKTGSHRSSDSSSARRAV